jgi:hypothetical protein
LKKFNQEILASFGVSLNPEDNFKSGAEHEAKYRADTLAHKTGLPIIDRTED